MLFQWAKKEGVNTSGAKRFKQYDISPLRGKVPSIFINNYLDDPQNIELLSFLAGLFRSCGDFDRGVKISEEIVNKADLNENNLKEISIAVWNLYILSKIYIEQERFDKAYRALDAAEKYWSRDLILVDITGMNQVRDKEDLWLRRAFAYMIQGRKGDFESIIDRVMLSRYELYNRAYEVTGEVPIQDHCLLDCFEYSSYMCRNMEDLKGAVIFIKTALRYLGKIPMDNNYLSGKISERKGDLMSAYTYYLKFYLTNRAQCFGGTLIYGTCKSCAFFETQNGADGMCRRNNISSEQHKACSKYIPLPVKAELL
ncbi:MAG: hypothetical protein QME45_06335 [Clostridiales bacterium]|nr:hypothetical protein [Clostridiales bacterium]